MEREQRFRFIGFLFYAVLVLQLAATVQGTKYLQSVLSDEPDSAAAAQSDQSEPTDFAGVVPALLGLGVVFFSSEASGYLLSSIITLGWNLTGGYSGLWKRNLGTDLRSQVVKLYADGSKTPGEPANEGIFKDRLQKHNPDVLLNYFWQTCPERLVLWEERRVTAFFIGCYAACAIALANIVGWVLACSWRGLTCWNTGVVLLSIPFFVAIVWNACCSYTEMWQIIDLWQGRLFDSNLHCALRTAAQRLIGDELSSGADRDGDRLTDQRVSPGRPDRQTMRSDQGEP